MKKILTEDERNILIAKKVYELRPFATKVYLAMQTRLPFEFIKANWQKITGHEFE